MPKVSVVVPIYGVEKYIERCVRSLFSQTLDDIEFVFIDDCTIDNSMLILENLIIEFEEHIDNMHWSIVRYKMPRNSGLPSVRKRGIELATGDYILHCDSDDWMDSNMVSDMWNLANDRNLDVVICDFFESTGKEEIYCTGVGSDINTVFFDIFKSVYSWALWNKLFKKELYDNSIIFPKSNIGEDMALTLQLLHYGKSIGHVGKPLYYYFKNPTSMTQTKTDTQIINNMLQWKDNVLILESFFKHSTDRQVHNCLLLIKYKVKNCILPLLDSRINYRIWRETFKEINISALFCPYIDIKSKLLFLALSFGLFSFYKNAVQE